MKKVIANKDSFGFQNRYWKKGEIAILSGGEKDFPAKHFDNLDGSSCVEKKAEVKEELDHVKLDEKLIADLEEKFAEDKKVEKKKSSTK